MSRERKYNKDEQTHFAKKHKALLNGVYMSDVDGFTTTLTNSENEVYMEWTYNTNSTLSINRFVETKSRKTEYIKAVLEGERKPSQQLFAFVSVTTELNAFRKANKLPLVDCLLVIEDFGDYPYEVYRITQKGKDLGFTFLGRVFDDKEYKQMFQIG